MAQPPPAPHHFSPERRDEQQQVREEGFSKDADKLVRRLSLVALLLIAAAASR